MANRLGTRDEPRTEEWSDDPSLLQNGSGYVRPAIYWTRVRYLVGDASVLLQRSSQILLQ